MVPRNVPPGLDWNALPQRIDAVLVTHNHRDHMDRADAEAPRPRARVRRAARPRAAGSDARASRRVRRDATGGRAGRMGGLESPSCRRSTGAGAAPGDTNDDAGGAASSSSAAASASTTRATPRCFDGFAEIGQRCGRSTPRCCRSAPTRRAGSCASSTWIPSDAVEAFAASAPRASSRCTGAPSSSPTRTSRTAAAAARDLAAGEPQGGAARDPRHRANAGLLIPGVGSGRSVRAGARRIAERRRGQRESRHRVLPRGASLCAGSRQE